ncbi:riboflavin synthase [Paenibacillus urinalis]|uniref:Riboflavin synthase n=1 Tax=Paenibacillus urinalis TaxID=521520 RepID=A0AAX3MUJ0_9BACL|nr:riboflavin synthase [Paenibacillus urinalis]WDH81280.1 riboflavin synthase [Paenibacillus urinalis]WDH97330.1 riboflavin synthase [Paenibacillus urinalis]WDI00994.1 riboflavin synthase [Paenibacillus urinalis]
MFTGLIEEVGRIRSVGRKGEAMVLGISAKRIMDDLKIGDSVAVNGVCLTATSIESGGFLADVMPETFRHTTLRHLGSGSPVNLERAMSAGGRFGGHIVQGHVDGTGQITAITRDQNAVVFEISPVNSDVFRFIIPKGSITIEGISLTVVDTTASSFTVSIIPHTLGETVLAHRSIGDIVNLECDILGKYVNHLLQYGQGAGPASGTSEKSKLSFEFLSSHGFN